MSFSALAFDKSLPDALKVSLFHRSVQTTMYFPRASRSMEKAYLQVYHFHLNQSIIISILMVGESLIFLITAYEYKIGSYRDTHHI